MNVARRLAPWALVSLSALPLAAPAAPGIEVEHRDGIFYVRVEMPVAAEVATAWQVLTDYNRLAEFVPDMLSSRIISAPGQPLLVEQKAETWLLLFKLKLEVVLRIEETPPARLEFRAVDGNLKRMRGAWRVDREQAGTRLRYEAEVEPDFWAPPPLVTMQLRRDIGKQFAGLEQEMLRRERARGDGAAPGGFEGRADQ